MVVVKHFLAKTGLFPKWEPQAYDILKAAFQTYEIRRVKNSRGKKYFCIIPQNGNMREIFRMTRVFRDNGIILIPKRPKNTNRTQSVVFWVRDRGQRFMSDAYSVSQDVNNFQQVLKNYAKDRETVLKKLFGKFEQEK